MRLDTQRRGATTESLDQLISNPRNLASTTKVGANVADHFCKEPSGAAVLIEPNKIARNPLAAAFATIAVQLDHRHQSSFQMFLKRVGDSSV
jgi:hypothetical protein